MTDGHLGADNAAIQRRYEEALLRRHFEHADRPHVVMGVSTTDLSEGRGDVYVAVGLGLALERRGYEVVYLPPSSWYSPPPRTDLFVSMLAERTMMLEPLRLPADVRAVAWVRNNTDRWRAADDLAAYDAVLCSSELAEAALVRRYPGPTGVLRIGVDTDLFAAGPAADRRGIVTTVNQWGGERRVYRALRAIRRPTSLAIYGTQRELDPSLQPHTRGPASFFSLPALYRGAQVVLDDQQDVNVGYGNVNSRIYESLACGALPVTNTRLGLGAIGLDGVPTYRTPAELEALLATFGADEARRAGRVQRLRPTVTEQHSYARRAEQLDAFLRTNGLVGEQPRGHRVVAFLPDYRPTNPYQALLYGRTVQHGIGTLPCDAGSVARVADRIGDRLILHVHWTATILGPATSHDDARARADAFLASVDEVVARGGKLVWTVHNVLPHECAYPDVEASLRQGLADRAAAIHVLCAETAGLVSEHVALPEARTHTIPHPSYVDVYGNAVGRRQARAVLGIDEHATVFLFLGQIRRYKGVDGLLDAFDRVATEVPSARLLVAGQPGKQPALQAAVQRVRDHPRVIAHLQEVPDHDLQLYLAACDVFVLPYRAALNSGALFLAWSFGRPVVAPDVGCIAPAVSDDTGVLFEPDRGDLAAAMLTAARTLTTQAAQQAAHARARSLDPVAVADTFAALLDRLASV